MRISASAAACVLVLACNSNVAPDDPSFELTAASGWTTEAPIPAFTLRAKSATVKNVIYVIGGGTRTVRAYDVVSRLWTTRKALPEPLSPNGATNISGKIYVAGGFYGSRTSRALYVYDPLANSWVRKADLPAGIAFMAGQQGAISGKLYVYGGVTINSDGSRGPHRFFRFDPATNHWASLTPPSYARSGALSGVTNGRFYLLGGNLPTSRRGAGYAVDEHSYDPITDRWTKTPLGRGIGPGMAYATLGKKLYIVGTAYLGDSCSENDSRIYDPATHTASSFTVEAPFRYGALGAAAGGRFFVIGGSELTSECDPEPAPTTSVMSYAP